MPTEIDKLVINIETESESTYKSINKLANSIGKLSNAVGNLDVSKLGGAANSISQFGKAVQSMSGIKTTDFSKLANGYDKFAKIDAAGLAKTSNGLSTLSNSLNALSNIQNIGNVTPVINAIKNLARVDMSGFDSGKMSMLASSVADFASRLSSVSGVDGSITRLVSALARLANSGQYISSAVTSFPQLGNQVVALVGQLAGADSIDASVVKIVDALARLASAGKKVQTTVANLQALGNGVVALVNQLNSIPQVNTNIANLVQGLGNIAASGNNAGNVVNGLTNRLNLFSRSSKTAKTHSFSLASAIGKVYATYWMLFRAMGKVREAIDISSQLTEVQNVVDTTFGKYNTLIEDFSDKSIVDYGMSELTSKKVASTFQAMGGAMGFAQGKMANMSVELTKLTADMASFYDIDQKDVAEDLQSIFTGQTRPLRQYGLDLTQATLKEWALKNGMDANIKNMSQMEKTMLRYKYVLANTKNAQGDFQKTQNTWANQTRILKENLSALGAVMGSVFINALKPMVSALNSAMSALIAFAKTVSESLGKIFGWQYEAGTGGIVQDFDDASDSASDIAGSTGEAADNIKKMRDGIRAFDKLNVINMPDKNKGSSSGSSSGSGSGSGSSTSAGEWTKVDSIFKDYESSLDGLYKLGDYIGTKLTKALEDIDWDSIYQGARNFGKGLANFLNGLISPKLFGAVGKTIAGALNTAIEASLGFTDTFDFEDFGNSLATGVNDFFKKFKWKKCAKAINAWVDGLKETIIGFLNGLSWKDIMDGVGDFLGELELDTISIIGLGFTFKFGAEVTQKAILGAIGKALAKTLGCSVATAGGVLTVTIATAFIASYTIGLAKETLGDDGWADQVAGNETSSGTPVPDTDSVLALTQSIKEKWNDLKKWWSENANLSQPTLTNSGASVPDHESALNIGNAIKEKWSEVKKWWKENVNLSQPTLTNSGASVPDHESALNIGNAIKEKWSEVKKWWKENVKLPQINVPSIGDITQALKNKWDSAKKWWDEKKPSLNKITATVSSIKDSLSNKWDSAKKWWNEKKSSLNKITPKVSSITDSLKSVWKEAKKWWNKNVKLSIPKLSFHVEYKKASGAIQKAVVKALGLSGWPSLKFYRDGGFPEEGPFFMNRGEIAGKFSNGKTAVANNHQITDGISAAVYDGNRENNGLLRQEIALLQAQNQLLTRILEKDTGISAREVFDSVRSSAKEYTNRTGNPAFI